jgi:hypothetical protein
MISTWILLLCLSSFLSISFNLTLYNEEIVSVHIFHPRNYSTDFEEIWHGV